MANLVYDSEVERELRISNKWYVRVKLINNGIEERTFFLKFQEEPNATEVEETSNILCTNLNSQPDL